MSIFQPGSPRVTAINLGVILSVLIVITEVLMIGIDVSDAWKIIIISGLSTFMLVYIFTYYMLKKLIINEIKPIYKTIKNIKLKSGDIDGNLDDINIVEEVNKDVEEWARHKTQEISHLKELEKYRKEFLGNVSHELKTPIFNIQGFISTLLDGGLYDESINKKYLERADKSIDRLISIVDDLNSISSIESGELELEMSEFDISKLITEIIEQQEYKAESRSVKIETKDIASNIIVKADRRLISQVLINLIVNSINYGKENGKTLISLQENKENVVISVKDNGIGIKEKDIKRLFERFYRVDKSRSKEIGGTGLGLSIVKHILEAHKQNISIESVYGKGTVFSFTVSKAF